MYSKEAKLELFTRCEAEIEAVIMTSTASWDVILREIDQIRDKYLNLLAPVEKGA